MKRKLICLVLLLTFPVFSWPREKPVAPEWVKAQVHDKPVQGSEDPAVAILYKSTEVAYVRNMIQLKIKVVYKILRVTGLGYGTLSISYSGKDKVSGIDGWRLNEGGRCLEQLEKDRISKMAVNENFVDDAKQIVASFKTVDKGDIVAFQYIKTLDSFFSDIFLPLGKSGEINHMEITVSGKPRIAVLNDLNHVVRQNGGRYEVNNVPYLKGEANDPPFNDKIPYLAISYDPGITDWSSFGWKYWKLASPKLQPDSDAKTQINHIFPQKDDLSLIRAVCRWVPTHINYVDIELGKGGIIPHPCSEVLRHRYGDCKDMAFLAAAILRSRGIQAFPMMAQAGSDGEIFPEFPGNQFNHVILAVKLDKNTESLSNMSINKTPFLIADMTDRITRIPFISESLEGTNALLVTPKGGQLVQLPRSPAAANLYQYIIMAHLYLNKSVMATLTEIKTGQPAFSELAFRDSLSKEDEQEDYRDWIQSIIPGAVLNSFKVVEGSDVVKTTCKINLQKAG
ncbi:MAG: DUF3857 and transglutaminase domain-containing protein, partial [Acidobacteria bacterium]|nr:DUF3857 and transglutaminase domain-containing protein [Acidobacteriota bacterium]